MRRFVLSADLSEFGVCLKVMMIDQIDYMHFERWTVKLLVTLEMKKKKTVAPTEKHNQFYWLTGQLKG